MTGLVEIRASRPEQFEMFDRLPDFRRSGKLCDVCLISREGDKHSAHKLILSLASEPLAMLIARQAPGSEDVTLDFPSKVISCALEYVYTGSARVATSLLCDFLKFSHMFALSKLLEHLVEFAVDHMCASTSVELLQLSQLMDLPLVYAEAEKYIAHNFEACKASGAFNQLDAPSVLNVIERADLSVSAEESVLQAVWDWRNGGTDRDKEAVLLLSGVRFPLLAESTLAILRERVPSMGRVGMEVQRRLQKCGAGDAQIFMRYCFKYHWKGFGCSISGGMVVAGCNGSGNAINQLHRAFSMDFSDKHQAAILVGDCFYNQRIVKWPLHDGASGVQLFAGTGAAVNGDNNISAQSRLTSDAEGHVYVAHAGKIIRFRDGRGEAINLNGVDIRRPILCARSAGPNKLLVLDSQGGRIVELTLSNCGGDAIELRTVAGGNGYGAEANQISKAMNFFVAEDASIYIADRHNHRIQKWEQGASEGITVAGGNGAGDALNQLSKPSDVVVSPERKLYIADEMNHRVVMWEECATSGFIVAGGHGLGIGSQHTKFPTRVLLGEGQSIFVLESSLNSRVSRWGPQPMLSL